MSRKACFLDRDDNLIEDKVYLNDVNQLIYLPRALDGLKLLHHAGFVLVIVTNQSGVPRGLVEPNNLHQIHQKMAADAAEIGVPIAGFFYAPFLPDTDHPLRKPNPGMLLAAADAHDLDLKASWMFGDRMTDVEAGHRAGCRSALVGDKEPPGDSPFAPPEIHTPTFYEAAEQVVAERST